jgi:hypothetical protein
LKKNSVYIEIVLCTQCPHHRWQSNPDPDDWFRDDECDLICTYNNKANIISSSLNVFEQKNPNYTTSLVPLNKAQFEVSLSITVPKWCPLKKKPTKKHKKEKLKETIII